MPSTKAKPASSPAIESIAFVSLGCPKNLVDSEKMLGLLAEDGIAITPDHDDADAIVINTCGFLEASKTESLDVIREAVKLKTQAAKRGGHKRVIVAGCLVQRHRAQLLDEVPGIDALVGVFDREHIVKAVRGTPLAFSPLSPDSSPLDLGSFHPVTQFIHKPTKADIGKGYTDSDRARLRLTPRHFAYLRVSEGCNQGCTFCTIPSIRGRMRSKPIADILSEAEELLADGAVELNLIGQDTTSFGTDIGYTAPGEGLPGLLRTLDRHVTKIGGGVGTPNPWLRLMYAYPSCFTDEMIKTLADCPRVVKYIDMPLQHISDDILQAMRRKVTRKQTETLLEKLRAWVPGITLRTTLISGFPGETAAHHKELLAFVKAFQFDCLGVFEYSPEPGTPAGRLHAEKPVPPELAAERKEELMLAQQKIVLKKNQALVGQTLTVLVDSITPLAAAPDDHQSHALHAATDDNQAHGLRPVGAGSAASRSSGKNAHSTLAIARHQGQAPDIDGRVLITLKPTKDPREGREGGAIHPGDRLQVQITDYNYYDLTAIPLQSAAHSIENRKPKTENRKKLSLPVLGRTPQSVESQSKRG